MNRDEDKLILVSNIDNLKITAEDLRKHLWLEIASLRSGKTSIERARAVSRLAAQIIDSCRVEASQQWKKALELEQ